MTNPRFKLPDLSGLYIVDSFKQKRFFTAIYTKHDEKIVGIMNPSYVGNIPFPAIEDSNVDLVNIAEILSYTNEYGEVALFLKTIDNLFFYSISDDIIKSGILWDLKKMMFV